MPDPLRPSLLSTTTRSSPPSVADNIRPPPPSARPSLPFSLSTSTATAAPTRRRRQLRTTAPLSVSPSPFLSNRGSPLGSRSPASIARGGGPLPLLSLLPPFWLRRLHHASPPPPASSRYLFPSPEPSSVSPVPTNSHPASATDRRPRLLFRREQRQAELRLPIRLPLRLRPPRSSCSPVPSSSRHPIEPWPPSSSLLVLVL